MKTLILFCILVSTGLAEDALPTNDLVYRWTEVEQPKTNWAKSPSLADKIGKIRIKEFKTENYTIREAVQQISLLSRLRDPDRIGVSIIIKEDTKEKFPQNISLSMKDAPVEAILKRVCEVSGYTYKVEEYAVFILPQNKIQQSGSPKPLPPAAPEAG